MILFTWFTISYVADNANLLPSPEAVASFVVREANSGVLFQNLAATLVRVIAAFFIAMTVGCAIGVWLGRNTAANRWADPWLVFLLNMPALVTIVLCFIWIGLTETAAITAVAINKIPMVTVMLREGARALDPALDDLARVYRMSPIARLRHIMLPQLAPHLAAAARTGLSLIWKIVLVVELMGASNGVGFQIHTYFQLFDVRAILGYALSFIAVMLCVEYIIIQPWERQARRWRDAR